MQDILFARKKPVSRNLTLDIGRRALTSLGYWESMVSSRGAEQDLAFRKPPPRPADPTIC